MMLTQGAPLLPDDLTGVHLEQAILNLRRHRFPFAPLLLKVDTRPLVTVNGDNYYQRIQQEQQTGLERIFGSIKAQAADTLSKLSSAQKATAEKKFNDVAAFKDIIEVKIFKVS